MKIRNLLLLGTFLFGAFGCTDLTEELNEDLTEDAATKILTESADVSALLKSAYEQFRLPYMDQSRFWAAQEHTSDEVMGPTRGPDWDDNGIWRVLHAHTWDADHTFLGNTFNELLSIVFSTTNILSFNPSAQQAAEARFLRAFVMFSIVDGWNQVPFRNPGDNLLNAPQVLSGPDAVAFIISECNAIIADLPEHNGNANIANKDAARVLLMKAYLNKGTFADRTNPTFPAADMDAVIANADALSGTYSYASNYFDNFAPNNDQISTENIFTGENVGGQSSGNVRSRWFCTLHYNQNPSGWNGFTTISSFYDTFDASDPRIGGTAYNGQTNVSGINVGFLVGQQKDQTGANLQDRKGNPLAFTKDVSIIETGNDLEITGIRVVKYPIDYNNGDNVDNDYVYLRYADAMLMKAEALMRKGNNADALAIVNGLRTARGAATLSSIDADAMIKERGFELYWEGHRRTDLIRFGKFLNAWHEKAASGSERLLFPIPSGALAVNPNLTQNPGY
jgi:starch-binding outer membrane protein, SusD/RagB family